SLSTDLTLRGGRVGRAAVSPTIPRAAGSPPAAPRRTTRSSLPKAPVRPHTAGMPTRRIQGFALAAALAVAGCRPAEEPPVERSSAGPTVPQSSAAPRVEPPEALEARAALVRKIAAQPPWTGAEWDPRVLGAMQSVPRHLFVPGMTIGQAYADHPQPIGQGQ